ncbi:MAG: citrate transporter [Clostridiales bacterium]|nr:citrate transporter [Candidatus Cacconaster stercorequi]
MARIKDFIKREITLCIAFLAAVISCFWVRPDSAYWGYIDFRTLALLYCLIVVVAGLRGAGMFSALAHWLCSRSGNVRTMGVVLVALCFVSAMLVTNDVALLTFVPFSVVVMGLANQTNELAWVVVLQTVAANLGSMLTPVGNPQNLYLYSYFNMSMGTFLKATVPIWLISGILIGLLCLRLPTGKISVFLGEKPTLDRKALLLYLLLFAVCMLVVLRVMDWPIMLAIIVAVLLVYERRILLKGDFLLLLTFVCFFVFAGNLARIDTVNQLLRRLLSGHEMLLGAGVSQIISNVPAAILLSGFTDNAKGLLLGVDIGGLGTPVASLASLISLKLYSHAESADTKRFLGKFLLVNFSLLAVLLTVGYFL